MLILIGCEESQEVCKAFRAKGHEAYSCDLLPCSGGHPEWHIQGDVMDAIQSRQWDMIGLHCPCTYTALCSNRWYYNSPLREQGATFTKDCWDLSCEVCDKVYLEQPKTIMQRYIGPKTQAIQPWMFGHLEAKETWLWLKGLPVLTESNNVYAEMMKLGKKEREKVFYMSPSDDRGKLRSKTYPGIAQAMADQWG